MPVKSAWGCDDPTKAACPFLHAKALAEAGHDAQIFLLGKAVSLIRRVRNGSCCSGEPLRFSSAIV